MPLFNFTFGKPEVTANLSDDFDMETVGGEAGPSKVCHTNLRCGLTNSQI